MKIEKLMMTMSVFVPEQCTQRNEDVLFNCMTKKAPVTAMLPSIRSFGFRWVNVNFFDSDLNADKNIITIKPEEGDRINGSSDPIILSQKGAGAMLIPFGINDWKCIVFDGMKSANEKPKREIAAEA